MPCDIRADMDLTIAMPFRSCVPSLQCWLNGLRNYSGLFRDEVPRSKLRGIWGRRIKDAASCATSRTKVLSVGHVLVAGKPSPPSHLPLEMTVDTCTPNPRRTTVCPKRLSVHGRLEAAGVLFPG